ncbi:hypothetical protein Tsubulata_039652 [Turnera subulata]|uniref:Uncharacterized protein n=1 Tax=Turnera subulata TaxID=218843 RepID=A0A9Q0FV55_9ROSI|nr:hypothetical protein Tsubulata_039652 [Turnera subulata]
MLYLEEGKAETNEYVHKHLKQVVFLGFRGTSSEIEYKLTSGIPGIRGIHGRHGIKETIKRFVNDCCHSAKMLC